MFEHESILPDELSVALPSEDLSRFQIAETVLTRIGEKLIDRDAKIPQEVVASTIQRHFSAVGRALQSDKFTAAMYYLTSPYFAGTLSPFSDTCFAILHENIGVLEACLQNERCDKDVAKSAFHGIVLLLEKGTQVQRVRARKVLDNNSAFVGKGISSKVFAEDAWKYCAIRYLEERAEGRDDHAPIAVATRSLETLDPNSAEVVSTGLRGIEIDYPTFVYEVARSFLEQAGVDRKMSRDIVSSWRVTREGNHYPTEIVIANVLAIRALLKHDPDSVGKLYRLFGITHFGRYPVEVLMDQLSGLADKKNRFGVFISAYDDWNGAFYSDRQNIGSLWRQLKKIGYRMRIIEARGRPSLARRLISLKQRYGRKMEFRVIMGHGSRSSVTLGRSGQFSDLESEPADTKKTAEFGQELFVAGAPMLFISCSTGKLGGIAQSYSRLFGGDASGPKENTSVERIQVHKGKSGLPVFTVEYRKGDPAAYLANEAPL